jgi:hypothetical protein
MASDQLFKTWLALGLAGNLLLALMQGSLQFGPAWLWLVLIPLSAYALIGLPEALAQLRARLQRSWRHRHGAQAVRVRRSQA